MCELSLLACIPPASSAWPYFTRMSPLPGAPSSNSEFIERRELVTGTAWTSEVRRPPATKPEAYLLCYLK